MTRAPEQVDIAVIGAGIVGLATARAVLEASPQTSVVVLEKEPDVAVHQSGRSSGVLHTGVYYPSGTAKAAMVAAGRAELLELCAQHGLTVRHSGKVIVATRAAQLHRLATLTERAAAHGLRHQVLGPEGLRSVEPAARGVAALHLPDAAVVDFAAVTAVLAGEVRNAGGEVRTSTGLIGAQRDRDHVLLALEGQRSLRARRVVSCAGLHADRVAELLHGRPAAVRILPFRGEYHALVAPRSELVRGLIYPVPDPRFPFLGVHLTRDVHDHVHVGPNAVLASAREAYARPRPSRRAARDVLELLGQPPVRALARRYWLVGAAELWRSHSRRAFAAAAAALVPGITAADLAPHPAGIRAQAVRRDGTLVDDFAFQVDELAVSVLNAPSPAATASLAIGRHVAQLVLHGT